VNNLKALTIKSVNRSRAFIKSYYSDRAPHTALLDMGAYLYTDIHTISTQDFYFPVYPGGFRYLYNMVVNFLEY
jgi:hypothetical protein